MNFDPVPEHEMLRDSVREFFARELPEERIREMDRARRIPRELWKRFAQLGWMGLSVPEDAATGSPDHGEASGSSRIRRGLIILASQVTRAS